MRRRGVYLRNRDSLGALAAGLFGQATLVVSGPATARLLGVTGRGDLAILAIVLALTSQIAAAGLPTAVAYTIAMHGMAARSVLSAMAATWIALCAFAGLLSAAVTLVVGHTGPSAAVIDALLVAVWVVSSMSYGLALACLQGEGRFRALNWVRPISSTLTAVGLLCLLLVVHRASVSTVLAVIVIAGLIGCLIAARVAFGTHSDAPQRAAPVSVRQLLRYGLASMAGASAPLDSFSIDQLIVGVLLSRGQLGLYVVGGAFNNLPSVLLSSLGTIALPRIAAESLDDARRHLIKTTAIAAALIAGLTTVLAELIVAWLLPLAFGANFSAAVPVARILIVAGFFLAMRRILVVFLQAVGRPGRTGVGEIAALAVLAISALLLIPPLGLLGAGGALALAAGASDLYLWLALTRRPR